MKAINLNTTPHFLNEPIFEILKVFFQTNTCSSKGLSQDYNLASHTTYIECVNFYSRMAGPTV